MTDKELLELAAKAIGLRWSYDLNLKTWNPLTDDGDALRLAVRLGFFIHIGKYHVAIDGTAIEEAYRNEPYAATSRAIVRAAAEIGKGK